MESPEWLCVGIPHANTYKISFIQANVESVLLYGCESWTLKGYAAFGTEHQPELAYLMTCKGGYQGSETRWHPGG